MPPGASCRELKLFQQEGILPLPALYISQVLIFFKKNPQYLANSIFTHEYETRHKNRLQIEKHNTKLYETGLLYAGQSFYNKLPKHLQNENKLLVFKKNLKSYLLEKNLYKISVLI